MGCVTSKVMTRTGSFQEELSQSLKRRHRGVPALQEILFSRSKNGGDPFLVIYNADAATDDTKQSSDKHINPESVDTWDLMEGLEESSQLQDEEEEIEEHYRKQQSQSFRFSFSDYKSSGESSADIAVRSKSFHTVDEYDAIMMERNRLSPTNLKKDWEDGLADYLKNVNKVLNPYSSTMAMQESISDEVEERNCISVESDIEGSQNLAENVPITSSVPMPTNNGIVSIKEKVHANHEKGTRRKAMAKDLTLLAIPSTVEFSVIATEDNEGNAVNLNPSQDQYYYETPRFGSFGFPLSFKKEDSPSAEEIQDACVFDPEMVSSLEVAMQQLQREEDLLLKQMGNMLEGNT